jgi:hypothetical protein
VALLQRGVITLRTAKQRTICGIYLVLIGVAASCRDYAGSSSTAGGDAGSSGNSELGQPMAGAPDTMSAGNGGEMTTGAPDTTSAGSGGDSDTGSTGDGGAANPPVTEGDNFGAVRLFIDGEPVCGGTLLNNVWIITADSCIPSDVTEMTVAFGADSSHPDQVTTIVEVARFPGNDGTAAHRGRNVVLLQAAEPFRIAGQTDNFHIPLWHFPGGALGATQRCAGWSFSPESQSASTALRVADLTPFAVDAGKMVGPRQAGDWVWWVRSTLRSTGEAVLPTVEDLGSGCFYHLNQLRSVMSLQSAIPTQRFGGQENLDMEAVGISLAEAPIRAWVDSTLLSGPDYLPLPSLGPVAAEWSPNGTLEIVGVEFDSGHLLWFTREDGKWLAPVDLGAPAGVSLSKVFRPAAIFRRFGELELLAVADDGALWWKRRFGSGKWQDWAEVTEAQTAITSGVHVAEQIPGHFHVVARGTAGELRHAEYEDGWLPEWRDLGYLSGEILGEPAVDLPQEGRLNVFVTQLNGTVTQVYWLNGMWDAGQIPYVGPLQSPPTLGRWSLDVFDFLGRGPNGNLVRDDYQGTWGYEWNDLGVELPEGDPVVALQSPGHGELFVSEPDGAVWHVQWPRRP